MKSSASKIEERQFITKEFADTLAGKVPSPYLRVHDPVQKELAEFAASVRGQDSPSTAYLERMMHFWRELSLAGMPRSGRAMDDCFALLFESAFDLTEAEPDWAIELLAEKSTPDLPIGPLTQLANYTIGSSLSHADLVRAFTHIYAPWRETDENWRNETYVALGGEVWFWASVLLAAGIEENDRLWDFRCAVSESSQNCWADAYRLHARLIREAPQRALTAPRAELMAHPILRIARLKYCDDSVEQTQVLRFLNLQCIKQGFQSEEEFFGSDLTLAQWVRDARHWATNMLKAEGEICEKLFHEAGEKALDQTRMFYHRHLGPNPACFDSLDAAATLIQWAKRHRGFEFSRYRAQLWEFVVEVADAALWLGWLFPGKRLRTHKASQN